MTTTPDAVEQRERGGAGRVLDVLGRQFVPGGGPRTGPLEAVAVFVVAAALAFLRLGAASVHARVWAEDGAVFLQQAAAHGPIRSFPTAYAGYLHGVPRLAAAVVYPFPVRWWGAGLHVADALVFAWVALLVYVGLSDQLRSRIGRGLAALYLVLVPVGPEIVGSIANIQWFLVVGAVVALLWTPRTALGWIAICLTTLGAVTSSPLGAVVFACALVRYVLRRGPGPLAVMIVTTVGYAAQVIRMLNAQQRPFGSLFHQYGAKGIARGYLSRVAGDGVLGMDRLLPTAVSTSVLAGSVVIVGLLAVVVLGTARRWPGPWSVTALLLAASVATFLVAVLLQPAPLPLHYALLDGRYYVAPALFLVIGLIVLGAGLLERRVAALRTRSTDGGTAGRSLVERGAASVLGLGVLALTGALAFGMITTYNEADLRGRNSTITWSHAVQIAQRDCRSRPPQELVAVPILPNPAVWKVRLRCSQLRQG